MSSGKTEIVIVGGSSGAALAHKLSGMLDSTKHALTLIDARPCDVHLVASLRMLVTDDGHLEQTALIPYDKLFVAGKPGVFKQGRVERVLDTAVEMVGGERVPYDILVVATGSKWDPILSFPDEKDQMLAYVEDWRRKFAAAQSVAIIGGGAVGIELASEIKHYHPKTDVTIVHGERALLNDIYPDKFRKATATKVEAKGIKLLVGDRLEPPVAGQTTATTKNGASITADLFIPVRGGRPNTDILRSIEGGSALTPTGTVKVSPTLQVQFPSGKNNVFAMGDIIEWPGAKMIAKTGPQAEAIAQNIVDMANGQMGVKAYPGFMDGIFITLGPTGGSGYIPKLWGIVFGDWVVGMVKSKGLFVSNVRKGLGHAS